jgi:uncharacterized membrane protein YhaH (DUF805 family)
MAGASPVQTQEDLVPPSPAALGYRWAGVLLAPAVAVAVHLVLVGPFGIEPVTPSGLGGSDLEPLDVLTVLLFALGTALVGWLAVALLERSLGARGRRIWVALALGVLVVSLIPVALLDVSSSQRWALVALHLVVAVVLIPTMASSTPAAPLRRGNEPVAAPHHDDHAHDDHAHDDHAHDPSATDPHHVADPSHS